MEYKVNTPEGTRDRLFSECLARRSAQSPVTSLFKRRGYSEIITPEVEYYDMFVKSGNPLPQESMLKLVDRSGRILVMRPDCTAPIARVAATRLRNSVFPQRLYYNQTIFRSGDANAGSDCEIAQCGIELIGAGGLRGDVEVIAMAIDTLEACKLDSFYIELGHVGYFAALAAELGANAETVEEIRGCIESKNYAVLNDILKPYGTKPARALSELAYLFGGAEVLDEAGALAGSGQAAAAVAYLREIYDELAASGRAGRLRFDLGIVQMLDYYTGVVFRGYAAGAGVAVLSGGRYDNLVGCFGKELPATGFSMNVDAVAACLPPAAARSGPDTLVHCERGCLDPALRLVDSLPAGSCELSPCEALGDSMALAREKGAKRLVVAGAAGNREVPL